MKPRIHLVALVVAVLVPGAVLAAPDSGNFVVTLGQDTVSVEHYVRTPSQVVVDQVGRSPRVLRRHFVYDLTNGALSHWSLVVTPPGETKATQTIESKVDGDSLRMDVQSGSNPLQKMSVLWPRGSSVVPLSSPWTAYEGQSLALARGKADSVRSMMTIPGLGEPTWLRVRRLGKDSIEIVNGHEDLFHARVDKQGHLLGVLPISGTGKFAVTRVNSLDLDAMASVFSAREKGGAGLGVLSPRDTVKASAGGAALWIDYGRPAKRGRAIYGQVVPYGEVWRTGANAATQFKTDKPLDFGGTVVPAGFYTLWTIPSASGWKLVINGETGQWGTEHKADKDLYTIPMVVTALPEAVERFTIHVDPNAQGGVMNLDWDTTRASAAFTVKP